MDNKYYLNNIFQRFIQPYFSINNYVIYLEWDLIRRAYKYVIIPKGDPSKYMSLFLFGGDKKDDFQMTVVYTIVDEFNNHNTRKLTFLLAYDEINRFNSFYKDFVSELDEKSLNEVNIEIIRPAYLRFKPKHHGKSSSGSTS